MSFLTNCSCVATSKLFQSFARNAFSALKPQFEKAVTECFGMRLAEIRTQRDPASTPERGFWMVQRSGFRCVATVARHRVSLGQLGQA